MNQGVLTESTITMNKENDNYNKERGDIALDELKNESSQHADETDVSKQLQLPLCNSHEAPSDGKLTYALSGIIGILSQFALVYLYSSLLARLNRRLLADEQRGTLLFIVGKISIFALLLLNIVTPLWMPTSKSKRTSSKVVLARAVCDCIKLTVIAVYV